MLSLKDIRTESNVNQGYSLVNLYISIFLSHKEWILENINIKVS